MFLPKKYKNTLLLGFSLLLVAYFICIRAFFLVHQFSHHTDKNFQQVSISQSDSKNIIAKNTAQKPEDKEDDCLICYLANFYQNNIVLVVAGAVLMMSFVLVNNFISIKNLKILSLLFSYQTRAPPVNF